METEKRILHNSNLKRINLILQDNVCAAAAVVAAGITIMRMCAL